MIIETDANGISDVTIQAGQFAFSYFKTGRKKFHVLRQGRQFKITGKNITIEVFDNDTARLNKFKEVKPELEEEEEKYLPQNYRIEK